jgi:hypothetical protein
MSFIRSFLTKLGLFRPYDVMHMPSIEFVSEQQGPPEQKLKAELVALFRREGTIDKAYLVRTKSADVENVVLALVRSAGADMDLVQKVGELFAAMFGRHEHLDVLFLSAPQQATVREVCAPFFER